MGNRIVYIIMFAITIGVSGCIEEKYEFNATNDDVFESLWTIIDERYCFVEDKHIDWDNVHEIYKEKIKEIDENDEIALFDILEEMLDLLQDGHVNIYTPFDVSSSTSWYKDYPNNYSSSILYGKYITDYRRAGGIVYTLLNERIGYIKYDSFSDYTSDANLYYAFSQMKDCKGIVIDVRSNGGGSIEYALKFAASFMDTTTVIGYSQHKTGKGHNDFSKPEKIEVDSSATQVKWLRPVAVLTNRRSYSATNLFANAMRYAPQAVLIGGQTGGGGGMPLSYDLPNGWMIRFSSVKMLDREMVSIEDGIRPDYEVNFTSTDKDDILEYAIEYLSK